MKCPRCGLAGCEASARCAGCGFTIAELDARLGAPPGRPEFVDDGAGLLDDETHARLVARIRESDALGHGEIVVAIRAHTRPVTPAEYAFWLFNRWRLGAPHHRAVLVLLALSERRIETEVGYGLDSPAAERATALMLEHRVLPHLREHDYPAALLAAVAALGEMLRPGATPEAGPA